MNALQNVINYLKAKADETWRAYEHINGSFPIKNRDDQHEHLIREARARWSAWNKAHLMALKEAREEINNDIQDFNIKHKLN